MLVAQSVATVDVRAMHRASPCGRSLAYGRFDLGTRTLVQVDVELVDPAYRRPGAPIEYHLRFGPFTLSNRTWYANNIARVRRP